MNQTKIIVESAADQWLEKNRAKLGVKDLPTTLLQNSGLRPKRILEVGSSNGWRLAKLRSIYGCEVYGLEPGENACKEAAEKNGVPTYRSTADNIPYETGAFDLVILGFCMLFCEPKDHFRIVAEVDRVLADGGFLVVYDYVAGRPHKARYPHNRDLYFYFMDFMTLWLAHPSYRRVHDTFSCIMECSTLLHKNMEGAFPEMKDSAGNIPEPPGLYREEDK